MSDDGSFFDASNPSVAFVVAIFVAVSSAILWVVKPMIKSDPDIPEEERIKVVIVGGGIAGVAAGVGLRSRNKTASVVMIEPKDYVELFWATYRTPFDAKTAFKTVYDLGRWCKEYNVRQIRSMVTNVDHEKKEVTIEDGSANNGKSVVPYDVCVLACGAGMKMEAMGRGPKPVGVPSGHYKERLKFLKEEGDRLLALPSVLIVGGGLVGVEVAGDMAYFVQKGQSKVKITLVECQERLCPEIQPAASAMLLKQLEQMGVRVVLNEKLDVQPDGKGKLSDGSVWEKDQIVWTIGLHSVHHSMLSEKVVSKKQKWIEVDDHFRVKFSDDNKNSKNDGTLFSLGDCCTFEPKSAYQIMAQSGVIGHNLNQVVKAMEKNKKEGKAASGANYYDNLKLRKKFFLPDIFVSTIGFDIGVAAAPKLGFHTQYFLPWFKNTFMWLYTANLELGLKMFPQNDQEKK